MNELLIAVRAFHFVAAVLLFGTFAFLVSVARPVFRRASQPMREEQFKRHRRLVQIAAWSLAAFFLSDLLWLAVQAATMSGAHLDSVLNRGTLGTVLGDTLVWSHLGNPARARNRIDCGSYRVLAPGERIGCRSRYS